MSKTSSEDFTYFGKPCHTGSMNITEQAISPILYKILTKRGYSHDEIPALFSWDLKTLPDLLKMHDLEKAARRIIQAINNKEKIGIYGDYDVDGTTSCALLYHYFQMLDVSVSLYQPSRFKDGYGLHNSSIDQALSDQIRVLISVDCGISNVEVAEYAKDTSLDLIITDHHKDAAPIIPRAFAVVNPNRRDEEENSPLRVLAGVGVAFCLCHQIREILLSERQNCPSLYPLLQFFAIGTISDLAKLTPLNLTLTRHGLKQLPNSEYQGLRPFFTPEERSAFMALSEKVSFNIGPMINSKGRLDHPKLALDLMVTTSSEQAYHLHSQLINCNNERKHIQNQVFEQAREILEVEVDNKHSISVIYAPDWHEGVIGIVASKLVELYRVPAIVFTDSEESGLIKASARTAGDLSIFDTLKACEEFFVKFGGHKAAAGLSMKKEFFKPFKEKITQIVNDIPHNLRVVEDVYDLEIEIDDINEQLVKSLEQLEPFGQGNPKPVFKLINAKLESYRLLKDIHVKWSLGSKRTSRKLSGISFNYIGAWNAPHPERIFENQDEFNPQYLCTLGINRYKGVESIQLMIVKVILN